jgi:hypothetical protein
VWRSAPGPRASFKDVPLYDRDAGEIEMLWKMGAITACSESPLKFCPDAPVTRAEFVQMLSKVLKRPVGQLADANRPITRGEAAGLLAATAMEQTESEAVPVSVQASYAGVYGAPGHPGLTVVLKTISFLRAPVTMRGFDFTPHQRRSSWQQTVARAGRS